MIEFQIIKVALRQIVYRFHFFNRRCATQWLITVQFVEFRRCQRGRQKGQHVDGVSVKVGHVIDVFVRIDWSTREKTKLVNEGPFGRILNEDSGCRIALRGKVCFKEYQSVTIQGFHVDRANHADGGRQ